jgi:LPXTG-motif cell wall-anchored protein
VVPTALVAHALRTPAVWTTTAVTEPTVTEPPVTEPPAVQGTVDEAPDGDTAALPATGGPQRIALYAGLGLLIFGGALVLTERRRRQVR